MRVPNHKLNEEYIFHRTVPTGSYSSTRSDPLVLPAGSFVRPIRQEYLPYHILNDKYFQDYLKPEYVFCYTRYGLLPIPKKIIVEY